MNFDLSRNHDGITFSDNVQNIISRETNLRTMEIWCNLHFSTSDYYEVHDVLCHLHGRKQTQKILLGLGWSKNHEFANDFNLDPTDDKAVLKTVEYLTGLDDFDLALMAGTLTTDYFWNLWNKKPLRKEYTTGSGWWVYWLAKDPELQKVFWRNWNTWRKLDASVANFEILGNCVIHLGAQFDQYQQRLLNNPHVVDNCNKDTLYHDMFFRLSNEDDMMAVDRKPQLTEEQKVFLLDKARGAQWNLAQDAMPKWHEAIELGWIPSMGLTRFFEITSGDLKIIMEMVIAKRSKITAHTVPKVYVKSGEWVVRTLELESEAEIQLGLTIGEYTGCCQKIGSAAQSSALASVSHGNQQVLIAEKNGEIYAQSWMWRCKDTLVLDNLEIKASTHETRWQITKLWLDVAKTELVDVMGIKEVYLGLTNGDHVKELVIQSKSDVRSLPKDVVVPEDTYSDTSDVVKIAG